MENQTILRDTEILTFLTTRMSSGNFSVKNFISKLKKYFYCNNENSKLLEQMKYVLPNNQIYRYKLGEFVFKIKNNEKLGEYKSEVFLFISPTYNTANVSYYIKVGDIGIDKLIYLRKIIQFNYKEIIILKNSLFLHQIKNDEFTYIGTISDFILNTVYRILANKIIHTSKMIKAFNCETYQIIGCKDLTEVENKIDNFNDKIKTIYGVLNCDEGWRNIPIEHPQKMLEKSISFRDYNRNYVSNIGLLSLNCKHIWDNFVENITFVSKSLGIQQTNYTDYEGIKPYIVLTVENILIQCLFVRTDLLDKNRNSIKNINEIIRYRRKAMEISHKLEQLDFSWNKLSQIILEEMGVYGTIRKIKENSNNAEETALLLYQKRNNLLIMLLTIIGVIFTGFSVKDYIFSIWIYIMNLIQ